VNVRDVNDNAPIFTQDRYQGRVSENDNVTTYITRVLATDEDTDLNGEIEYSLQVNNSRVAAQWDGGAVS